MKIELDNQPKVIRRLVMSLISSDVTWLLPMLSLSLILFIEYKAKKLGATGDEWEICGHKLDIERARNLFKVIREQDAPIFDEQAREALEAHDLL